MLHWNSFWAPTEPDGKTTLETAPVWKEPWPAEQLMAWQTLTWEHMLNASHAWWSLLSSAWTVPAWTLPVDNLPKAANDPVAALGLHGPLGAPGSPDAEGVAKRRPAAKPSATASRTRSTRSHR